MEWDGVDKQVHKLLSEKGHKDRLGVTALEVAEVEFISFLSPYQLLMCGLGEVT